MAPGSEYTRGRVHPFIIRPHSTDEGNHSKGNTGRCWHFPGTADLSLQHTRADIPAPALSRENQTARHCTACSSQRRRAYHDADGEERDLSYRPNPYPYSVSCGFV